MQKMPQEIKQSKESKLEKWMREKFKKKFLMQLVLTKTEDKLLGMVQIVDQIGKNRA